MKKILLLTLTILCMNSSSFYAQNTDLSNLDKKQRNEYLIKLAKEVVLNFGPEYYQEDYISDVSADSKVYKHSDPRVQKYVGKKFYTVTFRDKEGFPCSSVEIWEKEGTPKTVTFDGESGYNFYSRSYRDWIKDGVKEEEKWKRENDSQHHH